MKIGILGAGNVGGALGTAWAQRGHQITFGVRDQNSQEVKDLLARAGTNARAATVNDAVASADVILAALPWPAVKSVLAGLDLNGKILLDCTNPLLPDLSGLDVGITTSGGEQVAVAAKGALVVKIFNTTGAGNMANSAYPGKPIAMFYCGDDAGAKTTAAGLASEIGFEAIDAGPLTNARLLEPFALLWISLAIKEGLGTEIAFQLARR